MKSEIIPQRQRREHSAMPNIIDRTNKLAIAFMSPQGWFEFTPKEDITASELAGCLRIILLGIHGVQGGVYKEMVQRGIERHFKVME